jgi:hypothetical protein
LHAGKIFLVFLDTFPHLGHGVPFGYEPRAEDRGDFPYIARVKPVEAYTVDF